MDKKVLIVEDDPDTLEMIKFWVETLGYQVMTANNGLEAINQIMDNHPDFILMDYMMPILDGVSATRKIRELLGVQIPIYLITAFDVTIYQEAFVAGCNNIIPKPIDFDKVAMILKQYLR
jgi:CheY-like chemotaxis protein